MLARVRAGTWASAPFDELSGCPQRKQNVLPLGFSWPQDPHAGWVGVPQYGQ
jgi:hypothetical protein